MNDPYTRKLQVMLNSARYLLAICVNILVLVLILYGVSRVCICGYHFCYAVFGTVTVDQGKGQEKIFQVETNRSMYEVADKLQKQGLIVISTVFMREHNCWSRILLSCGREPMYCVRIWTIRRLLTF